MFKLIRLAVYALVGYAVYQFITDVMQASEQAHAPARGTRAKAGNGKSTAKRKAGAKAEATHDSDGGSTRHRVGRGVI